MKIKQTLFIFILALCCASCATIPSRPTAFNKNLTWSARERQLSSIHRWQIRGAMAIKANNQALTIYYNWKQIDSTRYVIQLFGPLGIGAVTITGQPNQVVLVDSKNQSFSAKNPETLVKNALGFQIPLSNLYYWIRGLPAPDKNAKTRRDSFNHLIQTTQSGWDVQFLQYTGIGKNDLPNQLIIKSKTLFSKIIVSEWQI